MSNQANSLFFTDQVLHELSESFTSNILKKNFYELLGLETEYRISNDELEKHYLALQNRFHPDKFTQDQNSQIYAVQITAYINEAYSILKTQFSRAKYLLSLHKDINFETNTLKDNDFLMEQMELQETFNTIDSSEDSTKKMQNFLNLIEKKIAHHELEFEQSMQQKVFSQAENCIQKMCILDKLKQKASHAIHQY